MDIIIINVSIIGAYFLRFGRNLDMTYFDVYLGMALFITLGKLLVFHYFGVYRNLWKYASVDDLANLVMPIIVANGLIIIAIYFLSLKVPRSIYAIATFTDIFLLGVSRFGTRTINKMMNGNFFNFKTAIKGKRVLIIGAGEAAGMLIQETRKNEQGYIYPVCAIDDNEKKIGKKINGVPILGNRYEIPNIVQAKKVEEIIIAIPSISSENLREIVKECEKTSCAIKILPTLSELKSYDKDINKVILKKIRDIDINDLLGRKEVQLDLEGISDYIRGKKVMVTGGAGSIGSELCRQIMKFQPQKLYVLDISEENIYSLMDDISFKYKEKSIEAIIASITDKERIESIFKDIEPNIVFHTAAYKHVHFMEKNPQEAIKNNIYGTINVATAADKYNAERFILISTDKAVNPTNVYGATKRICEMIVQGYSKISKTEFVAVRFGNVLGSRGSVIPLFKKQIERGGPVTVTHPEIIRYFMTIPEAAQLVIQAGAMAKGGEIFILDMGEPVKIDSLARELIKLSGFEPDKDIKIEYVGLRPGEKLYEELLMEEEGLVDTRHNKIFKAKPMEIDLDWLIQELVMLGDMDSVKLKKKLKEIVPTYSEGTA